jgi:ADP-ribose pyrophosphatase
VTEDPDPTSSEFVLREERELHRGHVISLSADTFETPDGSLIERDVVHHPGAVSVVPLLDDGTVVLVRQFRAALRKDVLEIPAGKRDVPGEPPEVTAGRELREEVGLNAGRMELLATFYNSAGFSDEHSFVYLGRDLVSSMDDRQGPEEQYMTVEHHRLADVPAMIADGRLRDAKTIIGLLRTLQVVEDG